MIEKSNTILVTGASGFLGSYIVRYLVKLGYTNIIALRRKSSKLDLIADCLDKVEWCENDILNVSGLAQKFREVDYVIHTAALIDLSPSMQKAVYKINVEGTQNIVNLCLEFDVKKLIHLSSIAALGMSNSNSLINESTEWLEDPMNGHYGKSKYQAELEVWRGAAEGLEVVILNPGIIIGAGFWDGNTSGIVRKVENGIPYYPLGSNGIVDVRDVALAAIKSLENQISSERIIISSRNMTYRAFFDLFASALNRPGPKMPMRNMIGGLFWRLDGLRSFFTGSERLLTKESFRIASCPTQYDNSKSLKLLNMEYRKVEDTIRDTVECYRSSKKEYGVFAADSF